MHRPLVSVIIVNWNGMHYLEDCLGSFFKSSYKNVEIFFVDNASSDESVAYVRKNYPTVKIIQNKENLGFAEGHEEAFRKAKGEAILLLSMDTIVAKNLLEELIDGLYAEKNIGVVQPKVIIYPDKVIDSIGSFFLASGLLYHFGREKDPTKAMYNKQMDVFSAKGACMLFRKEVLDKTGLFDKDYFAYYEETDLCMRVWLAGYKVRYIPSTFIYHKGGGASGKMVRSYILFHSQKNRIATYLKNFSVKYILRVLPLTIMMYEAAFIGYLLTGRFGAAWSVQKAIGWNIFHVRSLLKKRNHVQTSIRTVTDDSFMPSLTRKVSPIYYYYQFFGGMGKYVD